MFKSPSQSTPDPLARRYEPVWAIGGWLRHVAGAITSHRFVVNAIGFQLLFVFSGVSLAAAPNWEMLIDNLIGGEPENLCEAAKAIQAEPPKEREDLDKVADAVKSALSTTRDVPAQCALRLALGKLAAAGVEDAAEWGFESMSVTHNAKTPPEVFEAHARALEMVPGAAKELMIGNLDVALNFPEADPKERQRIKEFVVLTAEALKTRELADFLGALLTGEEDLFVKIEAPLESRLLACYKNVKAEPPITADAVTKWLDKHPGGPAQVEIAVLETISTVGATDPEAAPKLAARLLENPANTLALAKSLQSGRLNKKLQPQILSSLRRHAPTDSTGQMQRLLTEIAEERK
ncbi:MAG TPA: hypothetical protein VGI40_04865 [Pirellulaceae bacterium]|jgi:hypothetical protein